MADYNAPLQKDEGLIARVGGRNKFVDFRNALTLANSNDYAMLQGVGGKKHAPTSGISINMTESFPDPNNPKGPPLKPSNFVNAILPCYVIDQILAVCQKNSGATMVENKSLNNLSAKLNLIAAGFANSIQQGIKACANIVTGKAHEKGPFAEFGLVFKAAKEGIKSADTEQLQLEPSKTYTDYSYHQDRVNMYKRDKNDDFVSVSTVDITRTEYSANGDLMGYPWNIAVKTFWAPEVKKPNETSSYDGKRVRDITTVFMKVSDADMYRCCYAVEHFIRVWENAFCIPLVMNGVKNRDSQRMQYRSNNQ